MRRRLFKFAATFSALLLIGTLSLWARSYFVCDSLSYASRPSGGLGQTLGMGYSVGGTVIIARQHYSDDPLRTKARFPTGLRHQQLPAASLRRDARDYLRTMGWERMGFGYVNRPQRDGYRATLALAVPHWMLSALTSILPAAWLVRRRRRRRTVAGCCGACGYDLRATPARCPECGGPAGSLRISATPVFDRTE